MNMILSFRHGVVIVMICFTLFSCSKQEVATFTVPSTYRYNSPTLVDKFYYIRTATGYKQTFDTLQSFLVEPSEISDSINKYIFRSFEQFAIRSIKFLTTSEAELTLAVLDTTTRKFINDTIEKSNYTLSGNMVIFDKFSTIPFVLDNDFLELRQCNIAADRLWRRKIGTTMSNMDTFEVKRNYDFRLCSAATRIDYIDDIKNSHPNFMLDTLAIYNVDLIFTKY